MIHQRIPVQRGRLEDRLRIGGAKLAGDDARRLADRDKCGVRDGVRISVRPKMFPFISAPNHR
jgi:hypothetical protein